MKTYPSLPHKARYGEPIYAFDKIDGSNIRAEWTKKKGFHRFGKRHHLIDESHEQFGEAVPLIQEKYADALHERFKEMKYQKVLCFFEFWGPNSFAGNHEDEEHTVTLFDIAPHQKGILKPKDFLDLTEDLDIAELLYQGTMNKVFEEQVRKGNLEGVSFEGVVCKVQRQKSQKSHMMWKIKSENWLDKLKNFCNDDSALFERLI